MFAANYKNRSRSSSAPVFCYIKALKIFGYCTLYGLRQLLQSSPLFAAMVSFKRTDLRSKVIPLIGRRNSSHILFAFFKPIDK